MDDNYYEPEILTITFILSMRSKSASLPDKEITLRMPDLSKDQLKRIQDIVGEGKEHSPDCEMVKHGYSDCTCGFDKPTCERCFGQGEIAGPDMKLYNCPECSDPITTKE